MSDCDWWDVGCKVSDGVQNVMGDAIENMATAVLEAVGVAVGSVGTMWVHVGTPNLTEGDATTEVGATVPFSEPVLTLLGYITWIGLAIAVVSAIVLGTMVTLKMRQGEGIFAVGKMGLVFGGVILISAASSLVAGLLPSGPSGAGGTVAFLQGSLWWLMIAVATGGVIVGGARMAIQQRAQPGKDVAIALFQLIVIAGAGVTFVGLLVTAMDSFSVWLINASLSCDVTDSSANCFGENISLLLGFAATNTLGPLLVIVLGLIALLCAVFQVVLMIARGGMLVILTGILPLSAAAAVTGEAGKGWLNKNIAWLIAFILYKPAAAIIYAAAFQLVGTDLFTEDEDGLLSVLTGVMMMILALFALPALMRFVTPMVGSMAAGAGGGAMAAGAMAAAPSGAASMGRMFNSGGSSSSGGGSSTTGAPSGADQTGGSKGGGSTGGKGGPTGGGAGEAAKGGAAATKGAGAGAGAGGGAAAAGGGAAAGAGGGAAAAGAAGGPVGIGVAAAAGAAKKGYDVAKGAAEDLGNDATSGGPSGS